jgi:hypothetical protein
MEMRRVQQWHNTPVHKIFQAAYVSLQVRTNNLLMQFWWDIVEKQLCVSLTEASSFRPKAS